MTNPKSKIQNPKWLAPLALAVFVIWLAIVERHHGTDFQAYYAAGQMIRAGQANELYSPRAQAAWQNALHLRPWMPFCHLPLEAILLVPFAYFSYPTAYVLWCLFNFVCVGLSAWILARWTGRPPGLAFWAALSVPVASIAFCGQDTGLLLLVYSWAFVSFADSKDELGGCALGLALFRYGVTLPFLALLLPLRRFRALPLAGCWGFLMFATSQLIVGPRFIADYLEMLRCQGQNVDLAWLNVMPSLRGLFGANHPTIYLATALAVLALGMWAIWTRRGCWLSIPSYRNLRVLPPIGIAFAIGIPVALAVDPHGFAYGWVLLAIPAAILEGDWFANAFFCAVPLALLYCAGVHENLGRTVIVLLAIAVWSWRILTPPRIRAVR